MITGITAFVLLIPVCLRFTKKRVFAKIHIPASAALIAVIAAHSAMTFRLLKSRPFAVSVTGILAVLMIFAAFFTAMKRKRKAHGVSAFFAVLLVAAHVVFNIIGVTAYQNQVGHIAVVAVDLSEIPDGMYVGECDATYIFVRVRVTVKSGEITDIELLKHRNERGQSAEAVVGNMIERQKTDVDAVTGATNSSKAIMKAVENALTQW
jgi:uncharacterized protein with FMN-binding domain